MKKVTIELTAPEIEVLMQAVHDFKDSRIAYLSAADIDDTAFILELADEIQQATSIWNKASD